MAFGIGEGAHVARHTRFERERLRSPPPGNAERAEVAEYLAKEKDKDPAKQRASAIADLTWAIVASVEFRFNH